MGSIRDSSELREAARILGEFLKPARREAQDVPSDGQVSLPDVQEEVRQEEKENYKGSLPSYGENDPGGTRLARIEAALELMCGRGGFESAVLVGDDGFIVASWNMDMAEPELAGLCTRLSDAAGLIREAFGGDGGEPIAVELGGMKAGLSVIGPMDARFVLAGFSTVSEPDLSELGPAASHIGSLLG